MHLTFATPNRFAYERARNQAVKVIKLSAVKCYLEGEFIPVDTKLPSREFSVEKYERWAPVATISNKPNPTFFLHLTASVGFCLQSSSNVG